MALAAFVKGGRANDTQTWLDDSPSAGAPSNVTNSTLRAGAIGRHRMEKLRRNEGVALGGIPRGGPLRAAFTPILALIHV
jgi:hypothetical protein